MARRNNKPSKQSLGDFLNELNNNEEYGYKQLRERLAIEREARAANAVEEEEPQGFLSSAPSNLEVTTSMQATPEEGWMEGVQRAGYEAISGLFGDDGYGNTDSRPLIDRAGSGVGKMISAVLPDAIERGIHLGQANIAMGMPEGQVMDTTTGQMRSDRVERMGVAAQEREQADMFQASRSTQAAMHAMSEADGLGGWLSAATPQALGQMLGESVGQQLPQMAITAGSVGLGLPLMAASTYNAEFQGAVEEAAQKDGVDINDPRRFDRWMRENPTKVAEAESKGRTRGGIIAGVDLVSFGAGGAIAKAIDNTGIKRAAFLAGANLVADVGGGAGGEAAAQLATEGKIQMGEVLNEGFAGLPLTLTQTPGQIAEGVRNGRAIEAEEYDRFNRSIDQSILAQGNAQLAARQAEQAEADRAVNEARLLRAEGAIAQNEQSKKDAWANASTPDMFGEDPNVVGTFEEQEALRRYEDERRVLSLQERSRAFEAAERARAADEAAYGDVVQASRDAQFDARDEERARVAATQESIDPAFNPPVESQMAEQLRLALGKRGVEPAVAEEVVQEVKAPASGPVDVATSRYGIDRRWTLATDGIAYPRGSEGNIMQGREVWNPKTQEALDASSAVTRGMLSLANTDVEGRAAYAAANKEIVAADMEGRPPTFSMVMREGRGRFEGQQFPSVVVAPAVGVDGTQRVYEYVLTPDKHLRRTYRDADGVPAGVEYLVTNKETGSREWSDNPPGMLAPDMEWGPAVDTTTAGEEITAQANNLTPAPTSVAPVSPVVTDVSTEQAPAPRTTQTADSGNGFIGPARGRRTEPNVGENRTTRVDESDPLPFPAMPRSAGAVREDAPVAEDAVQEQLELPGMDVAQPEQTADAALAAARKKREDKLKKEKAEALKKAKAAYTKDREKFLDDLLERGLTPAQERKQLQDWMDKNPEPTEGTVTVAPAPKPKAAVNPQALDPQALAAKAVADRAKKDVASWRRGLTTATNRATAEARSRGMNQRDTVAFVAQRAQEYLNANPNPSQEAAAAATPANEAVTIREDDPRIQEQMDALRMFDTTTSDADLRAQVMADLSLRQELDSNLDSNPVPEDKRASLEDVRKLLGLPTSNNARSARRAIGNGIVQLVTEETANDFRANPSSTAVAWYNGDKMYVNVSRLNKDNLMGELMGAIGHEGKHAADASGKGKKGIGNFIGVEANRRLRARIEEAASRGDRAAANAVRRARAAAERRPELPGLYEVELPAYYITEVADRPTTLARGLISAVRTGAKELLGVKDVNLNDIQYMADKMVENLSYESYVPGDVQRLLDRQAGISPGQLTGQTEELDQAAYHGTPHNVDRFTTQRIGSGEGNQSYGWGLYFASERAVAEYYRDTLGGEGNLYQVEVPESSDLIDYDRAVRDSSPELLERLAPAIDRLAKEKQKNTTRRMNSEEARQSVLRGTGKELYQQLVKLERTPRRASEYLNSLGVPGLQYTDGQSRGRTDDGTKNIVIWDDSTIGQPVQLDQDVDSMPQAERQQYVNSITSSSRMYRGNRGNSDAPYSSDGALGPGYYYTSDRNAAQAYGPAVTAHDLSGFTKPLVITMREAEAAEGNTAAAIAADPAFADENFNTRGGALRWARDEWDQWAGIGDPDFRSMLRDAGYDSVALVDNGTIVEMAVPRRAAAAGLDQDVDGNRYSPTPGVELSRSAAGRWTKQAGEFVRGMLFSNGGLGRDMNAKLQDSVGEAAHYAALAQKSQWELDRGIAQFAERNNMTLDEANAEVAKRMEALETIASPSRREAALSNYVAANPELTPMLDMYRSIAAASNKIADSVLARRPLTEADRKFAQSLKASAFAYTTRIYTSRQGEAGRSISRKMLRTAAKATEKVRKGKALTKQEQEAYTRYNEAAAYLMERLTIPPMETLLGMRQTRLNELFDTWAEFDSDRFREAAYDDAIRQGMDETTAKEVARMAMIEELDGLRGVSQVEATLNEKADVVIRSLLGLNASSPTASTVGGLREDRGILQKREDLAPELRRLMGEVTTSPSVMLSVTMAKQGELIARENFLSKLAESGFVVPQNIAGTGVFAEHTVKLRGDTAGTLKDMMTTPEIARIVNAQLEMYSTVTDAAAISFMQSDAMLAALARAGVKGLSKLAGSAKLMSVVVSPFAMLMNATGSALMLLPNGVYSPGMMLDALSAAKDSVINTVREGSNYNDVLANAVRWNVIDSARLQELRRGVHDALKDKVVNPTVASKAWHNTKRGFGGVTETFAMTDAWTKIAAFMKQQDYLTKFYEAEGIKKTADEISSEAAQIVRDTNFTYSKVPPVIRNVFERSGLTMFATYFWSVPQAISGNYIQVVKDIKRAKAATTEKGKQEAMAMATSRFLGTTAATAVIPVMGQMFVQALNGMGDEDEDKIKAMANMMRDEQPYADPLYLGKDKDGKPLFFLFNRFDPYGPVTDLVRILGNSELEDGQKFDEMASMVMGMAFKNSALVEAGKVLTSEERGNTSTRLERLPVIGEAVTELQGLAGYADWARSLTTLVDRAFVPGVANVLDPETPRVADDYNSNLAAVIGMVTLASGGKAIKADPDATLRSLGFELKEKKDSARKEIAMAFANGDSPERIADMIVSSSNDMFHDFERVQRTYNGMVDGFDMSPRAAAAVLKSREGAGLNDVQIGLIRRGLLRGDKEMAIELAGLLSEKSVTDRVARTRGFKDDKEQAVTDAKSVLRILRQEYGMKVGE